MYTKLLKKSNEEYIPYFFNKLCVENSVIQLNSDYHKIYEKFVETESNTILEAFKDDIHGTFKYVYILNNGIIVSTVGHLGWISKDNKFSVHASRNIDNKLILQSQHPISIKNLEQNSTVARNGSIISQAVNNISFKVVNNINFHKHYCGKLLMYSSAALVEDEFRKETGLFDEKKIEIIQSSYNTINALSITSNILKNNLAVEANLEHHRFALLNNIAKKVIIPIIPSKLNINTDTNINKNNQNNEF